SVMPVSRWSWAKDPSLGAFQHASPCEAGPKRFGDARLTPKRSGQLPADRPRGVGVVTQVDGPQHSLLEGMGIVEGPQGGFEALDHPPRSLNGGRLLVPEASLG